MKNKSTWIALAIIAGIAILKSLNRELLETILLVGTIVFIVLLGMFHYLDRKGKMF